MHSLKLLKDIAEGTTFGLLDMMLHVVDVRDCAHMHIAIMNDPATNGHRHLSFGDVGKYADMGRYVQEQYNGKGLKPSTFVIPKAVMWVLKFVSNDVASVYSRIGVHFPYKTKYPNVYTYEYTSYSDMVHASMESMIEHKWIVV